MYIWNLFGYMDWLQCMCVCVCLSVCVCTSMCVCVCLCVCVLYHKRDGCHWMWQIPCTCYIIEVSTSH